MVLIKKKKTCKFVPFKSWIENFLSILDAKKLHDGGYGRLKCLCKSF